MQIKTQADFKNHLTPGQKFRRVHFLNALRAIPFWMPRREKIDAQVFERVNRFSQQGGGVLFVGSHFSQREVIDFTLLAARFEPLLGKRADFPVALHQSDNRLLRFVSNLIAINFWPVFTDDTVQALQRGKYKWPDGITPGHREIVTLNEAYFSGVRECLTLGGAVFVALKPGRRPVLELTNDKPLQRVLMKKDGRGEWVDDPQTILVIAGASLYNPRTQPSPEEAAGEEALVTARYRDCYMAHNGANLFRKLDLRVNYALTEPERHALCQATSLTIDNLATALMATQVDYRYVGVPAPVVQNAVNAYQQLVKESSTVSARAS